MGGRPDSHIVTGAELGGRSGLLHFSVPHPANLEMAIGLSVMAPCRTWRVRLRQLKVEQDLAAIGSNAPSYSQLWATAGRVAGRPESCRGSKLPHSDSPLSQSVESSDFSEGQQLP
jgi:hypothetical protein